MECVDMVGADRPTIGFLTANVHVGAARSMWLGILDAAQQSDVNLVSYPGGRLYSQEDFEAERNIIYRLVDAGALSGMVSWTSALTGAATHDQVANFFGRYQSLPIVSLGAHLVHRSHISINGYQGMQELISHLIHVHGYRRVAFIRGPESHPYARERLEAYRDALEANGIPHDDALVTPSMSWEKGPEAMKLLLDERGLEPGRDFQAVVAVSDLLAIGALRVLTERGYRVPTDVAVAGFNDIEEGQLSRPPLTSVSLPFYEQAQQAVRLLMGILSGHDVPESVVLDSRLLVRRSCGCPSSSVNLAAIDIDNLISPNDSLNVQQHIMEHLLRVIHNRGLAATWAKQLYDAFNRDIATGYSNLFLTTLDGMMQRGDLHSDETAAWQMVISVLRRDMLNSLGEKEQVRAENLFGQARVLVGEAIQRAQSARRLHIERQNSLLREIGQTLITVFDIDRLSDVLSTRLPELGIRSSYLALYGDSFESSRLVMAYSDGKRIEPDDPGYRYPSRQLVPPELLPDRRYSFIIEPLYFQTEPIGYMVFEVGPKDGEVYEVLRGYISSALKGALLFSETHEARRKAERADDIKTRLLANVSHELRTPLNIIIGNTQRIMASPGGDLDHTVEHIQQSAEHQLRIINDLLDLSRAQINSLDLYKEVIDPRELVEDSFSAMAKQVSLSEPVKWELDLPDYLPPIEADPVRLRQVLFNLLSNAAKFTDQGTICLGAGAESPHLHLWVADTGIGVPPELQERIYEPFVSHEQATGRSSGIGLGLSIARHLVQLHGGTMTLESEPDVGSTFHIYLPLLTDHLPAPVEQSHNTTLWLISQSDHLPDEILEFTAQQGLTVEQLTSREDVERYLDGELPAVIAWDVENSVSDDWLLVRRLHNHPKLSTTPFILYQPSDDQSEVTGLTSLIVKPASSRSLWEAIRPAVPDGSEGSVLIIDDNEYARQAAKSAVEQGLPDYCIHTAENGRIGLELMTECPLSLVILDLMMPEMDGFEVLDRMRADEQTRGIPVVILSARQLSLEDVERLEHHANVTLQNKGILSEEEIVTSLHNTLFGTATLPPQTSALIKRTVAYLHQNYWKSLSRADLAEYIGMSEDYLSRAFSQELGISPWDYLNRYRIFRAKELLIQTDNSISQVARRVGFSDPAYFSRVFRKLTGLSPRHYRENPAD
ncbi:MAG: substrate-binding domain-containing protein [Anaerolineae bacterium]|nr:substrate-binding domain-containing protein [Anaerolineae bacterium]